MADGSFIPVPGFSYPSGRSQGFSLGATGPVFGTLDPMRGFLQSGTALTPQLRQQIMTNPWAFMGQAGQPAAAPAAPANTGSNVVAGPTTDLIGAFFKNVLKQGDTRNVLSGAIRGEIPPELASQISAEVAERMGSQGARFGTDTSGAIARALAVTGQQRMLDALGQLQNFGGLATVGESAALQRAMQEYLALLGMDPLSQLFGSSV